MTRSYKVSYIQLFLMLNVILLPIFDNVSGALFKLGLVGDGSIGSPSQLGRFLGFGLLCFLLCKYADRSVRRLAVMVSLYILSVEMFMAVLHLELMAFIFGIVFSIKILFCFLSIFFLFNALNNNMITTASIERWMVVYGSLVATLVLMAYASGFYISNYSDGIATRGLFISGNGLGVVIGSSLLLTIHRMKSLRIVTICHILFLLATTALIGTKASLLFCVIAVCYLYLRLFRHAPLTSSVILAVFVIYLLMPLLDLIEILFQNIVNKFDRIDDKWLLLASSRDQFIINAFHDVDLAGFRSIRFLFGAGAYYAYTDFSAPAEDIRKFLENDLFELFFSYGFILVSLFVLIYLYCSYLALKRREYFYWFLFSLIFLHSITVGHVVFNGTSSLSLVFAALLAHGVKSKFIVTQDPAGLNEQPTPRQAIKRDDE